MTLPLAVGFTWFDPYLPKYATCNWAGFLPTHQELPQFQELVSYEGFGKDVRLLVLCPNLHNGDIASVHIISEVVILDIDVLGSGAILVLLCNLQCTRVVLEDLSPHFRDIAAHREAGLLQLLEQFHDGYCFSQCLGESHVFTFCGAQSNLL